MSAPRVTLSQVLENDVNDLPDRDNDNDQVMETPVTPAVEGMCIECGDQPSSLHCEQCLDDFCDVCFEAQHRKGTRKKHTTKPIESNATVQQPEESTAATSVVQPQVSTSNNEESSDEYDSDEEMSDDSSSLGVERRQLALNAAISQMEERARYIPLRLSLVERKYLRLVQAAMKVSEYTDKVDIVSYKSKTSRIHAQVKDVCAILSGLVVASDYNIGQQLVKDKDFKQNEEFFQGIFELARRHKIMNPESWRTEYGKLLYMLQDTQLSEVQDLLGFSCVKPVKMVYSFLEERGGLGVLQDQYIVQATAEIVSTGKTRDAVQRDIKMKERAIDYLADKYENRNLTEDEIKHCLYSIGDNNSFLRASRDTCDEMIHYLEHYFKPDSADSQEYSLAIQAGRNGHRLTHSHTSQYNYVLQTLTLWSAVLGDMYKLWFLAESDLLDSGNYPYRLRDTGQGLNRVQHCPRVGKAMSVILNKVQRKVGDRWVGSSVVHLGDHNVPNALMFIDKYSQVPRILNPIVICLRQIEELVRANPTILNFVNTNFGSVEKVKKDILADFFRSAFDGSGADNFFDAGSCIDGRLTSAWNWCSKIEKKSYFPIFLLTGFVGFDGEFAA